MKTTRKGWMVAFINPTLTDMARDFIATGKGDRFQVYKPDWLPQFALEEFLAANGYREQVIELRTRVDRRRTTPTLDHLSAAQQRAVIVIMQKRKVPMESAIKWVVEHKAEVEAFGAGPEEEETAD
jgi:hypothetical protein